MSPLSFPWLGMAILIPLAGAIWLRAPRNAERAQLHCIALTAATLACSLAAWIHFGMLDDAALQSGELAGRGWLGLELPVMDALNAPLIPLTALLFLAVSVATLRTKSRRFSFSRTLVAESVLLATLSCRAPWGIVVLMITGTLIPWFDLRARGKPTRVFALHMILFAVLLITGQLLVDSQVDGLRSHMAGVACLMVAVLLRSGVCPVHCWMREMFEHAAFGTSLLFVTPMVGAYAAVRLVLPIAPDWALRGIVLASVLTAFYAAGMALVQTEARRFFCYLFLSHSSLVLVGVEVVTPVGLTGALSVWLSVSLALTGLGLTLRSIEARRGRISLARYNGLADHTPLLGSFFLITGLASAGFPGTFGFVATELLIEGIIDASPYIGMVVVLVSMINGIAVLHAYFRIFTGARHVTSISLRSRLPERIAVLALTSLMLIGGMFSQPGIVSRYRAALDLMRARETARALPGPLETLDEVTSGGNNE